MAKRRRARFTFKDERALIAMAATGGTVEDAAVKFNTSVETIQKKAPKLGLSIKNGRFAARIYKPVELKVKGR